MFKNLIRCQPADLLEKVVKEYLKTLFEELDENELISNILWLDWFSKDENFYLKMSEVIANNNSYKLMIGESKFSISRHNHIRRQNGGNKYAFIEKIGKINDVEQLRNYFHLVTFIGILHEIPISKIPFVILNSLLCLNQIEHYSKIIIGDTSNRNLVTEEPGAVIWDIEDINKLLFYLKEVGILNNRIGLKTFKQNWFFVISPHDINSSIIEDIENNFSLFQGYLFNSIVKIFTERKNEIGNDIIVKGNKVLEDRYRLDGISEQSLNEYYANYSAISINLDIK